MPTSRNIRPRDASRRQLTPQVLAVAVAFIAGGCQSYERQPLDLVGHRAAFLLRLPEDPEVKEFAKGLATSSTATPPGIETFDPSDGLNCEESEVIAMVFNADLRVARLRAGVTRASAENAGLWEDPTLGVDLARVIESTPEPWKVFTSVGLTIPISGRLDIEKQQASAEHAAELARIAQREWLVRTAVRRAWSEWASLDAQLTVTREFLARVDQVLAVVDAMEQAGEIARTEARLFRIEKATKAAELAVLESRVREADLRLRALMGIAPDAQLRLSGHGPNRARMTPGSTIDIAELERRSPAMLVAIAEYEAVEQTLALEIRKQYPDIHVGPGYGNEDGQDQVLLGLSLPIPILNANRRAIAEARAKRDVARASAEATLEQTIAAIRTAEVRLAAASTRRATLESEVVPLVDAQYADARQVAKLGEVNTLVLLESLKRQQEAKVALVEASRDEAIAAIDLDELHGPAAMPPTTAKASSEPASTTKSIQAATPFAPTGPAQRN